MAEKTPDHSHTTPTHDSNAGAPANQAHQQPTDEELDQRDREKSRPRRAAGPPLGDEGGETTRNPTGDELPQPTDPAMSASMMISPPPPEDAQGSATQASDAGRPADHVGPKPSDDDLDRRDRLRAGPRRAAGPPLQDDGGDAAASRSGTPYDPPPPTEPREEEGELPWQSHS